MRGWFCGLAMLAGMVLLAGCGSSEPEQKQQASAPSAPAAPTPPPQEEKPAQPEMKPEEKEKPAEEKPPEPAEKPEEKVEEKAEVLVPGIDPKSPEGQSAAKLKKIADALKAYHEKEKKFPAAAVYDRNEQPLLSWRVLILPYLGEEKLFKMFKLDEPWDSGNNFQLSNKIPDVYKTPTAKTTLDKQTCYVVPAGLGTCFAQREGMAANLIADGADKTLLVVEADADRAVIWSQPEDLRFIPAQPTSGLGNLRKNFFFGAFGDGTVRAINLLLDPGFIRALFTASGKEFVDLKRLNFTPGEKKVEGAAAAAQAADTEGVMSEAQLAFSKGDQVRGLNSLMTDGIIRATPEVMDSVQWSPGLKRPMLIVRWALAVSAPGLQNAPTNAGPGFLHGSGPGGMSLTEALPYWDTNIGQPFIGKLGNRAKQGQFGKWLIKPKKEREDGAPFIPGPEPAGPGGQPRSQTQMHADEAGIKLIGLAEQAPARKAAFKEGVDVLALASIATKAVKVKNKIEQKSTISIKLIDVRRNDVLYNSKPLENGKADERGEGGGFNVNQPREPFFARGWMGEVMEFVESNLVLGEVPNLTPEIVKARAEAIVAEPKQNLLSALFELRYYESKKLLTGQELAGYYGKLTNPEDGTKLATGTAEQRKEALRKVMGE